MNRDRRMRSRSRSVSPRPPRGPRGPERRRSPPRGPRNYDRHERLDKRGGREQSRSRSPPRGPRSDRRREDARERSPPRGPRSMRRGPNEHREPEFRDLRPAAPKPAQNANGDTAPPKKEPRIDIMDIDAEQDDDDAFRQQLRQAMGFGMFRTTKNSKVPGNDKLYAVRKEKKAEYRQYMNRQGGFNRPLSPT